MNARDGRVCCLYGYSDRIYDLGFSKIGRRVIWFGMAVLTPFMGLFLLMMAGWIRIESHILRVKTVYDK